MLNIKIQPYYLLVFYTPFYMSLTGITIVELILVIISRRSSVFIPQLGMSVMVILHQCSKKDDEDDLQDDAQQWQP